MEYVKPVKRIVATHYVTSEESVVMYIVYKKIIYVYNEAQGTFIQLRYLKLSNELYCAVPSSFVCALPE